MMLQDRQSGSLCPAACKRILSLALGFVLFTASFAWSAIPAPNAQGAMGNELILEVQLEKRSLQTDILGYQRKDRVFLALREFAEILQFPISVDSQKGLAGGWFIKEERDFSLDLQNKTVIVEGREQSLEASDAFRADGDIFVSDKALEKWFPLKLDTSIQTLSVNVITLEELPIESTLFRASRQTKRPGFTNRDPELPLKQPSYELLGHRATDARLSFANSRRNDNAKTNRSLTMSLLSRGDLAWMTSTLYLSGNEDDLTNARVSLERTEFDGPAGLNHVEIGDVLNTVGSGNRGIGVRGGNAKKSADGRYADDTIDLDGDILPGWQVELYRNGVLIEFQEVGNNGRYSFIDVPLVFGENAFEFIFYGPYGEVKKETVTHFVGAGVLGAGSVAYELSATQAQRSVFDLSPTNAGGADKDTGIYNADFNLGITKNLSTGLGVRSYEQDEKRRQDSNVNLNFSTAYFQLITRYSQRDTNYDQASASVRSRVGIVGFGASYTRYIEDGLEAKFRNANPQLWSSSLSTNIATPILPLDMAASYSKREQSEIATGLLSTTYAATQATRISTNAAYTWIDNRDNGGDLTHQSSGGFSVSTISRPWVLRGFLNYNLHPDAELSFGGVSGSLSLNDSASMTLNIERNFNNRVTLYRAGYNWDFDSFRISPQISYDSNERFTGLLTISTNFATHPGSAAPLFDSLPQANHGGALARAFIDDNGNGRYDPGEYPLPNVEFQAPQSFRKATTDEHGHAYLHRLPAYRQTDIAIDATTLPSAEQQPATRGNSVLPRPGHWDVVDYPVVVTAELAGTVSTLNPNNSLSPASRILVRLENEAGEAISSQRTAYDGRYIFTSVPSGTYRLTLTNEVSGQLETAPEPVRINSEKPFYQGLDFVIAPTRETIIERQDNNGNRAPSASPRPSIIPETSLTPVATPTPTTITAEPKESGSVKVANIQTKPGNWFIQVGAYSDRDVANSAWEEFKGKSKVLAPLTSTLMPSGNLIRLLAGPGMQEPKARALCEQLKTTGVDCLVRSMP